MTTLDATRPLAAGDVANDEAARRASGGSDASFADALRAATGDGSAAGADADAAADSTASGGAATGAGDGAPAGQEPRTAGGDGGGPPATTLGRMLGLPPVPFGEVADGMPSADGSVEALTHANGAGEAIDGAVRDGHPVIAAAEQYLGVPYKWGGTDPATGLDCSGFVQLAFSDVGIDLPRVSADQARVGTEVPSLGQARPGDLVYWAGTGGSPNHIGIYLGDGEMLHAPRRGEDVQVDSVRSQPPTTIRRVG